MAGGQRAEWEQGCGEQLVLDSTQARAGAGHRAGGTTPLPSRNSWSTGGAVFLHRGRQGREVTAGPEGPTGGSGRGATQLSLEGFLEEET